jgi:hypothetical protein
MNATSGKEEQVWRSAAPFYEVPAAVIDPAKAVLLVRRESQEQPPNYFLHDGEGKLTQVTEFAILMATRRCRRNRFCVTSAPMGWS